MGVVGKQIEHRNYGNPIWETTLGNHTEERNGGQPKSAKDMWETESSKKLLEIQIRKGQVGKQAEQKSCGKSNSGRDLWETKLSKEIVWNTIP